MKNNIATKEGSLFLNVIQPVTLYALTIPHKGALVFLGVQLSLFIFWYVSVSSTSETAEMIKSQFFSCPGLLS